MDQSSIQIQIDDELAGTRVDRVLAESLEISRAEARRLLDEGGVFLVDRRLSSADKGRELAAGDALVVADFVHPAALAAVQSGGEELTILDESDGWVVVDKPAGIPVHPLRSGETGTVLNALIQRYPQVHGVGEGGLRSGVVHRLDVETSGALVLALDQTTWLRLREGFAQHRTEKIYSALVLGSLERAGSTMLGLRIARHRPSRVEVVDLDDPRQGVRRCGMGYRPVEALDGATLVEAVPTTGFLHQLRVSFAHLGHPLAGDRLYGPDEDPTGAERHMLHAAHLRLDEIDVESSLPADMEATLERLRLE